MSNDSSVLRALLRISRRREAADEASLALRTGATEASVRDSLRRLESLGLVERRAARPLRLTMEGLAVAIALLPGARAGAARPGQTTRAPKRTPRAA